MRSTTSTNRAAGVPLAKHERTLAAIFAEPIRANIDRAAEDASVAMSLYETCTADQAVTAFGDPAKAEFFCDRQFAVFQGATLCFATMGDPETGTKLLGPSKVAWKPARLDYHPEDRDTPWLPKRLTKCVERDGAWLPLHHMFLRAANGQRFVYAGIAELPQLGDIPENGRVQKAAHFTLDAKLPQDTWHRLGGYDGRSVTINGTEHRLAATDVAGLERLLAIVPTASGYWNVSLAGYEEHWFTALFNAERMWLRFVPDGERGLRAQRPDLTALESWDPDCPTPRRREFFGHDGQIDVAYAAGRTVPREAGVRAAVEHFLTGRRPDCVRWRQVKLWG